MDSEYGRALLNYIDSHKGDGMPNMIELPSGLYDELIEWQKLPWWRKRIEYIKDWFTDWVLWWKLRNRHFG